MSEQPKEWNHPGFDEKGKVICQVCGKKYMIMTPSHLKKHDLTYSQYKDKFPGAPITNEEFKAISMYSRPSKYTEEDVEILGKETIIDDNIPVIDDDFEVPKEQVVRNFATPMEAKKHEIFDFLVNYFPDLKMDYQIEVFDGQNALIFSTISDYADPFLKVNIQFPDTFWHNMDMGVEDPNRSVKLSNYGWKVISVKGPAPHIKTIEKHVRKII